MDETTPYANSVFEQPWWLNIVAPDKWGEVFVKEDGEIVARMPYVLDGGHIKMPPMTQTLGPWIKPEYRAFQPGNTQLSKQKELIYELLKQLPKHRSFNMAFDSANEYILPYRWLGFRYVPTFSYRINDLHNVEAVYSDFNKTAKKNIKYARNKASFVTSPTPEMMMALLDKTFAAQRRRNPGNANDQRRIMERAIDRGNGKLIVVEDAEHHLHSGAFLLFDEKVCYYLVGGSDPAYRSSGAQSLVLWEAIQFASKVSGKFDFEGSNVEGIENFFRQFDRDHVINYNVIKQSLLADCAEMAKPRVKRLIGYKN